MQRQDAYLPGIDQNVLNMDSPATLYEQKVGLVTWSVNLKHVQRITGWKTIDVALIFSGYLQQINFKEANSGVKLVQKSRKINDLS